MCNNYSYVNREHFSRSAINTVENVFSGAGEALTNKKLTKNIGSGMSKADELAKIANISKNLRKLDLIGNHLFFQKRV